MKDKLRNLVTVDFDFFIRENPAFDFGHSELNPIFLNAAWLSRYMIYDIYNETDVRRYADFSPVDIVRAFERIGLNVKDGYKLYITSSHKHAFEIAKEMKRCRVMNFDAHSDLYGTPKAMNRPVECENWLSQAYAREYAKEIFWIKPRWLKEFADGTGGQWFTEDKHREKITQIQYQDIVDGFFNRTDRRHKVDAVLLCRSDAWVPPSHDALFETTAIVLDNNSLNKGITRLNQELPYRTFPTELEAQAMYAEYKKHWDEIKRKTGGQRG